MISETDFLKMLARTAPRVPQPAGPGPDREAQLHYQIQEYCLARGWLPIHSRMDKPTTQALGVSDFVIVTPKTVFFVECKRPGAKLTPPQLAFAALVRKLGWPWRVVYNYQDFRDLVAAFDPKP